LTMCEPGQEVDIIIAGGGTASCVIASRLSSADPSLSILIIEQGRDNFNDPAVIVPAAYPSHIAPGSETVTFYQSKPSKHLAGREVIVPAGRILGGGSSVNFTIYTRAQGIDYDSWNTEGWGQKDLLPLLKKTETYHISGPGINQDVHGYNGPIHITRAGYTVPSTANEFFTVAAAMGDREVPDQQDLKHCGGFSRWARFVSPEGKRQDAAHCFIHPLLMDGKHPNLHLLLKTKVVRILFNEEKRAVGLEYIPNADLQRVNGSHSSSIYTVKARKLVIIASGGLGTPQILERSGIGERSLLEKLGIPVISDLPGVGENYQDHHLLYHPYRSTLKPQETFDCVMSGRLNLAKALKDKNPISVWNGFDLNGKVRPTEAEVEELGGDFKTLWDRDFKEQKERPLTVSGLISSFLGDPTTVPEGQYFSMAAFTAYPYSRGSIHITEQDPLSCPDFDAGFLNHPVDVQAQVWAYKRTREIARRLSFYLGELAVGHPKFPEGSKAAVGYPCANHSRLDFNKRFALPNIEYTKEDDRAIEQWVRENINTTWHSLGTCAMKPRERSGVVDKNLNVYGVKGLKIADISIAPENVAANTNSTALVIGEKAAQIIAKELGLVD
ncbi:alcohol dehydrogenase, partial [Xylogone sp. PMI_703]